MASGLFDIALGSRILGGIEFYSLDTEINYQLARTYFELDLFDNAQGIFENLAGYKDARGYLKRLTSQE